ncbi:O-antigen polysaccharide polymerase Wzy [Methylobacter sp. YRD-M1]|uniref:O-antigen polysaccharide polymerase Wzy n=1 Tax=Methylobacter sp. YRD-M1 TaxID=2911520 RepID=UPI00227CF938|nr:O-antigen polysaccharide polymerase Wzy [Methylobacter sp. YRD-M1]WAK01563.1 O-antigen polysaccharide polymerase Wzy family protein [Methylobacter sp. YRD-M1]
MKAIYLRLTFVLLLFVLFFVKPAFEDVTDPTILIVYIFIFFAATFIHLLSKIDNKNWFRLDVIFLLGYGIVHFQWPIMFSISGIYPEPLSKVSMSSFHVNYGTWLATAGLVSWFLGHSFVTLKTVPSVAEFSFSSKKLFWLTVILLGLFLSTAGADYLSGGIYKGSQGTGVGEGSSVYFQLLLSISILVLTAINILNKKREYNSNVVAWILNVDKKYLLLFIGYVLLFLSIGDRGAAIQVVFAFLILFGSLIRSITFIELIIMSILGALALTLVGLGRSAMDGQNILSSGLDNFEMSSGYDITLELANSIRTLYATLAAVPEYHDYFYGKLWLDKILSIIPFAQNIYLQLSEDVPYEINSAAYITYLKYGLNPPSGEGTSLVADIFINFSLFGVLFCLFLLGMFFKKVENELKIQRNYYWMIIAALLGSMAFYLGRGSLFEPFRYIVWGLGLSYFFVKRRRMSV